MPNIYEARCLNCGNLGHSKGECPRTECRKCHELGHTGSTCKKTLPPVKFDNKTFIDKRLSSNENDEVLESDHLEKFYAS